MSEADFELKFVQALTGSTESGFPIAPARRDLLITPPAVRYGQVLYQSAVIARGWFNPGTEKTYPIFANLVANIISGSDTIDNALGVASSSLTALFQ